MANPKDILVVTSSSVEGVKIKRYLKPVSAHIVAGTNIFSDFLGGLADVFGGRSETYQKQLTSLYNEAIERIKYAAYEIGANCIVGLSIDMDEISGKGKSMFMLTAIGTAVILEKPTTEKIDLPNSEVRLENVGIDKINLLRNKKTIIEKANAGNWILNDDAWNFITINQVDEVFPFIMKKFSETMSYYHIDQGAFEKFRKPLLGYLDVLPEEKKLQLLYDGVKSEQNEQVGLKLAEIIKDLNLFDFQKTMELLASDNFSVQKRGLQVASYDKPFYNRQDVLDLQKMISYIQENFRERGTITFKKQLLSSKEKQVWVCGCGKTNDMDVYCSGCGQDVFGFRQDEVKPNKVSNYLQQKVELISEYLN
jgi:uncharacterized protein YbjQ (UPF0145 family)